MSVLLVVFTCIEYLNTITKQGGPKITSTEEILGSHPPR